MPYVKVTKLDQELYHYGIPKRSGRYPWGSGDRPYQSSGGSLIAKRKTAQNRTDELSTKTQKQIRKESGGVKEGSLRDITNRANSRIKRMSRKSQEDIPGSSGKDSSDSDHNKFRKDLDDVASGKKKIEESYDPQVNRKSDYSLRNDRPASEMTTKELNEYNVRRKAQERYEEYQRADTPNMARHLSDIAKNSSTIVDALSKQVNAGYAQKHKEEKARIDFSGISDEDLRKAVNRMNLEQQYRNLAPDVVSEGEKRVKSALSSIGTVLTAAQPILDISAVISDLYNSRR